MADVTSGETRRPFYRRIPLAVWGLIALAVGMSLGTFAPDQVGFIGRGVKSGFKFLASAAPFIIYFTISAAVLDMAGSGRAGKLAFWVTFTFFFVGLLGGVLAILMVVPMFSLPSGFEGTDFGSVVATVASKTGNLLHSSTALLAVIYAAITSYLLHLMTKWKGTSWFAVPTKNVIRYVGVEGIGFIGRGLRTAFPYLLFGIGIFIPTAVGDAVAQTTASVAGAAAISTVFGTNPVALYFLNVAIQVIILAVYIGVVIAAVLFVTKFPIKAFFRDYFGFVYAFAWATSSSAASIPVTLERTGSGLKVRKELRDFIVPLGATMNLDGAMVACFAITAFASILVGYYPTALDMILLLIPFKIATAGVPGIPGGIATVVPPIAAGILPLPPGTEATFLAIWFAFSVGLSDQFRTGINTVTNGIVALLFESLYPKYFEKEGLPAPATDVIDLPSS